MTNKEGHYVASDNIEQGNKLIAEYIGWEFKQDENGYVTAWCNGEKRWIDDQKFLSQILTSESGYAFHCNWNNIMAVVERIEQGNYGFKMCRKVVEIYYDSTKEHILKVKETSRLKSLWQAVVQFITWYNNQNK